MTMDELIREYYRRNPNGHYFDHDTLKWFGERVSDMRVLSGTRTITDISGDVHEAYTVSRLQRKYPGGPRRTYAYFDTKTFDDIIV